jgi:hypothetical protein
LNTSLKFDVEGVSDLQGLWEGGERVFCRGWRVDGGGGHSTVLAVLPAEERPLPVILERLAHEYELRDELVAAWAVISEIVMKLVAKTAEDRCQTAAGLAIKIRAGRWRSCRRHRTDV